MSVALSPFPRARLLASVQLAAGISASLEMNSAASGGPDDQIVKKQSSSFFDVRDIAWGPFAVYTLFS
ncbi:hypothetical protein PG994_003718 [Apiospora phragmitis]|uniref:Uncharacterized protein n=1 Tax=Apiospora phragmitis TaxID=2905665 RepID=A0ABR1W1K1_9PEZI